MKILIIGASSFLGNKLFNQFSEKYDVYGTCFSKEESRYQQLDITSKEQVDKYFSKIKPNVVILVSAFTNVDLSEEKKDLAWNVNVKGTQNIVDVCRNLNLKLIYIYTDYIFDGETGPYTEESTPNPINYYGKTKLEAEKIVEKELNNYIIIRPAIMYGYNNKNDKPTFVSTTINKLRNNKKFYVDKKRVKYPTSIDDISKAIDLLIRDDCLGIYNVSGDEPTTRFEWARKIANIYNLPGDNIIGVIVKEKVNKPRDVKLVTSKIKKLGMVFTSVEEGLVKMKNCMVEN